MPILTYTNNLDLCSEQKDDDASSSQTEDLLSVDHQSSKRSSLVSSDQSSKRSYEQSSDTYSIYTGISKQSTGAVSSPDTAPVSGVSLILSPEGVQLRRRKSKSAPPIGFDTKSNIPPLDFTSTGLIVRDTETSTLKGCYDRLMTDGKKELILVAGQSGVGKSSVIRSLDTKISIEGLFVEGKFDMNTISEPYSGVANAFGIICSKIKEAGAETIADLRQDLMQELGGKPGMLVHLIPELQDITAVEAPDHEVGSIDRVDETEGGVDRLRFAFRVLTRVFSAFFSPLVLFLDDLQWADVSEVDENSLLHNKLVAMREKTDKFQFYLTELAIESFSVSDIETVITTVVPSLRADYAVGLATLCHKRTLGNPFFAIEFLRMLHFERMLAFDDTTKTWSWNLSDIEKETMSTANVVVMLEQHLRKLPEQVQALLQCAAYLGSSFSEPTIDLVWRVYGRRLVETRTDPVSYLLPLLVADNIFEKGEQKQYRWAHDKLQEAGLSLSGLKRDTFQLDIGKTLYYGLAKEQVEEDLFIIIDLINNGNVSKRPEFAPVSLRAAEKAGAISAFQAASEYAAEGISLLQETDWVQNKSTALRLYAIGAETELVLGNVDTAERYRELVQSRSDLSMLEMLPFLIGKAKALGDVELKSKEALEYCLKLLKSHGCRLAWVRPLALPQAVVSLIRTMKKAKAKPQSFYETMKASDNEEAKFIGYLLRKAAVNAYTARDTAMYLLCTVKLVELTMEFGANEFSATAFSFLGIMSVIVLKDYAAMERFVNIGLGMLTKFRGMHAAESIFVGHQLGLFWTKPPEIGRCVAEKAILAGRREGELVYTSWAILQHVVYLPYTTGRPIHTILEGCPNILAEFEETKAGAPILSAKTYYQMCLLNLNDPSCERPSLLAGKIYTDTKEDHMRNFIQLANLIIVEGELVFWHEDYEVSAGRALKVGEAYSKLTPSTYLSQLESFHRAVALYAAAINTKNGKYKRVANKIRTRLAALARYENTTIQYYCLFLSAEHLALKKKHNEATLNYEQALEEVGKLGHLHHLGLFNERYAGFLQQELKAEKESRYRMEQAIGYYRQWGAVHKVKSLESRL